MREDEVFAAGVEVEAGAELLHRHDGAFDVPAGTAGADRGLPRSFAGLGSFPESEVAGAVFFVFVDVDAGAVGHAGKIFFRELAVLGKFGDAEIIGAVVGAVGETLLHQLGDELGHLLDVLGGADEAWAARC